MHSDHAEMFYTPAVDDTVSLQIGRNGTIPCSNICGSVGVGLSRDKLSYLPRVRLSGHGFRTTGHTTGNQLTFRFRKLLCYNRLDSKKRIYLYQIWECHFKSQKIGCLIKALTYTLVILLSIYICIKVQPSLERLVLKSLIYISHS